MKQFERNILLIGKENQEKLFNSKIIIFGIGGVGSYTLEALVRVGIKEITIVDFDKIDETNINRQLLALHSTIDKPKVEVGKERSLDINPHIIINTHQIKIDETTINQISFENIDYIIDAVDDVNAKLLIIKKAIDNNIPIISSMGTGNKLDPSKLIITDISKTTNCPLARVMRKKLRDMNINHLPVLFSTEIPHKEHNQTNTISSISFVPSTGGLLIAAKVVNDLIK